MRIRGSGLAAAGQGVAGTRIRERILQLALIVEPLEVGDRRLDLCLHCREGGGHRRDGAGQVARAGDPLDRTLDRADILIELRRELVEVVLRLLPGRGVGLAEPLQVGRQRLRRGLGVGGGRLQPGLRRVALDGVGGRLDRGLPGRDRRADSAGPRVGGGGTRRRRAAARRATAATRNTNEAATARTRSGRDIRPPYLVAKRVASSLREAITKASNPLVSGRFGAGSRPSSRTAPETIRDPPRPPGPSS